MLIVEVVFLPSFNSFLSLVIVSQVRPANIPLLGRLCNGGAGSNPPSAFYSSLDSLLVPGALKLKDVSTSTRVGVLFSKCHKGLQLPL